MKSVCTEFKLKQQGLSEFTLHTQLKQDSPQQSIWLVGLQSSWVPPGLHILTFYFNVHSLSSDHRTARAPTQTTGTRHQFQSSFLPCFVCLGECNKSEIIHSTHALGGKIHNLDCGTYLMCCIYFLLNHNLFVGAGSVASQALLAGDPDTFTLGRAESVWCFFIASGRFCLHS